MLLLYKYHWLYNVHVYYYMTKITKNPFCPEDDNEELGDVCYTGRFVTTIFSATEGCNIVPILFRTVTTLFQHCNAVLRWKSSLPIVPCNITFKQHRRRRLRKRHLKSEFALLQTLLRLFHLVQFVKSWQFVLELNSKRLVSKFRKRKRKSLSCVHRPQQNVKLGTLTSWSCSELLGNV